MNKNRRFRMMRPSIWSSLAARCASYIGLTLTCMGFTLFAAAQNGSTLPPRAEILYSFHPNSSTDGSKDGAFPGSELILDEASNLYGTTQSGGAYSSGTVFKFDSAGTESILYNFCTEWGCADGKAPLSLTRDKAGNLYGTTSAGGANGAGTIFRIDSTGEYKVLHNFCAQINCIDGNAPINLAWKSGKLYGVTGLGGANGAGVMFVMSLDGEEIVLKNCVVGAKCTSANLVREPVQDAEGNLYRTTPLGGEYRYGALYRVPANANKITFTKTLPLPTTTKISSNLDPAIEGQAVSFKAVVTSGAGVPTGTVTFYDGTTVIGRGALNGGEFVMGITNLPVGIDAITATYAGANGFRGSTSVVLQETIEPAGSSVAPPRSSSFTKTRPYTLSLAPWSGYPGAIVDISLSRGTLEGATEVTFNGVTAAFTVVSSSLITATVPANATSGFVEVHTSNQIWSTTIAFTVE
jgi:uncharacterized repeat protein (TIGR03803 family)